MRTVLVCVRTPLAAQSVASCAARLGVSTLRTAVTETEALARLAETPAELILVDTAVSRPDTAGFTRRLLAQAPRAVLVLFGAEEPSVAAAAVNAGARGLIRGGDYDLVGTVAKAVLLIGSSRSPSPATASAPAAGADGRRTPRPVPAAAGAAAATEPAGAIAPEPVSDGENASALVPAQRGDAVTADGARPVAGGTRLRSRLTERELQVLRGMADGRSNAEIGRELYVSEDTVKTHARRLFRKLGARDRAHAVSVGFRIGALP